MASITEVKSDTELNLRIPALYKVVYYNDDKTSFEFVIYTLMTVFHKPLQAATDFALEVHEKGSAIAGVFPKEIAEQKAFEVTELAVQNKYPLKVTFEKE